MPTPVIVESWLPAWSLAVCLFGLVGVIALGRWPNLREGATLTAGLANLGLVAVILSDVMAGRVLVCELSQAAPGMRLALRVDQLGGIFALVAATLWVLKSIYAVGYMRGLHEHAQTRFFACFPVAIAAAMGMAFAANLFTLFVFYEVLTLSTYALVIHHEDREAVAGAKRYLTLLLGTSVGLQLPALVMVWWMTGQLHGGTPDIEFGTQPLLTGALGVGTIPPALLVVTFGLFVFGVGKAALMPLHGWLPAAMVAPTPVSAFLHAVAVVKAGVFTVATLVIRVYGVDLCRELHLDMALGVAASVTIIVASLVALRQDNLKRLLAYSTVGQLSYIVLGVALCSPSGVTGGLMHIAMHACAKITLFFCAGAIFVATGKKYVSQMVGLGRRMPVTMGAFFVGTLGVIGLPPSGGFLSKWQLLHGSLEAGAVALLVVLLVSSFLNACYFFPIVYRAFFLAPPVDEATDRIAEAPLACVAPLVITAALSTALFVFPDVVYTMARAAYGLATGGAP